jgi:DNA-binding transcriptional MerR regulator
MKLKMQDVVEQSGISKSTILYYIKEGLLPQPEKPKPNVHHYPPQTLKILEFIKYFQQNLGYSIAQIKEILKDNKLDFNSDSDMILEYLSAMENDTIAQEAEKIYHEAVKLDIDPKLFEAYEKCAKELATLEYEMGIKLLTSKHKNENNTLQKVIFDIILKLKPFIFNRATIAEHKRRYNAITKDSSC